MPLIGPDCSVFPVATKKDTHTDTHGVEWGFSYTTERERKTQYETEMERVILRQRSEHRDQERERMRTERVGHTHRAHEQHLIVYQYLVSKILLSFGFLEGNKEKSILASWQMPQFWMRTQIAAQVLNSGLECS